MVAASGLRRTVPAPACRSWKPSGPRFAASSAHNGRLKQVTAAPAPAKRRRREMREADIAAESGITDPIGVRQESGQGLVGGRPVEKSAVGAYLGGADFF